MTSALTRVERNPRRGLPSVRTPCCIHISRCVIEFWLRPPTRCAISSPAGRTQYDIIYYIIMRVALFVTKVRAWGRLVVFQRRGARGIVCFCFFGHRAFASLNFNSQHRTLCRCYGKHTHSPGFWLRFENSSASLFASKWPNALSEAALAALWRFLNTNMSRSANKATVFTAFWA